MTGIGRCHLCKLQSEKLNLCDRLRASVGGVGTATAAVFLDRNLGVFGGHSGRRCL